jgi:DNA-directed RNA polymerase sigma subunit (sigma70/sigma32)
MSEHNIDAVEVMRIAKAVARRFKRHCWWADVDDLESEGAVAVLRAHRTFDPQVGVPFAGYATRAAALQITDYLWRQSSPVSGGMHDPQKHIAGKHRVGLDMPESQSSGQAGATRVSERKSHKELMVFPDVEETLDVEAWRLDVRRQLRAIASITKDGDLAVAVMVHDERPAEVIKRSGRNAYKATELVRRKVRKDAASYELWQRAPGRV